jgi:hypothetical protein
MAVEALGEVGIADRGEGGPVQGTEDDVGGGPWRLERIGTQDLSGRSRVLEFYRVLV